VDLYSRMVALFKVLLPLAALAILATLFLFSRGIELDTAIPFAQNEISDRMRNQQVTGPFFSGTMANGDEIIFEATNARPGGPGKPAIANNVTARLKTARGVEMNLLANLASLDTSSDRARFSGDVVLSTSTGIEVRTEVIEAALDGVEGFAPGEITGTSPFGDLTAGEMQFAAKNGDGAMHVLFKSGVKLIYLPEKVEK
jgi:lipopolysaccharide export system protein LptC